ncbi:MAG: DUF1573 domain-containing protein [Bacteroidales bacterium]|nr:DUF1573 domain-containing protein [Bacteroidales bacterium]
MVFALLFFLAFSLVPDEDMVRFSYPYAVADAEVIDLGKITAGSRASGELKIYNRGHKDLFIARVRSSCGLMIPTWPTEAIGRDEAAVINFRYNSSRLGPFERNIIVHTNAWQKTIIVRVVGEIIPPERAE